MKSTVKKGIYFVNNNWKFVDGVGHIKAKEKQNATKRKHDLNKQ